jgi:hypothetical protein
MGRHLAFLLAALLLPVLASAQATTSTPSTTPETAPARYRLESSRSQSLDKVALDVAVDLEQAAQGKIQFLCEVRTELVIREGKVGLVIRNEKGETVQQSTIELPIEPGLNKCRFDWDTRLLPYGIYWARFAVLRGVSTEAVWREVVVTKMAEMPLAEKIEKASNEAAGLKQYIDEKLKDDPAPYARMRLTLAQEFAQRARRSFAQSEWQRAEYYANYVLDTTTSVRVRLALANELPEKFSTTPNVDLSRLTVKNGVFYAGERPVFLLGGRGGEELLRDLPRLHDMGLNLAAFDLTPGNAFPAESPQALTLESVGSAFGLAKSLNVSTTVLLSPFKVSDAAAARWPELRVASSGSSEINLVTPQAREYVAEYLRTALKSLQGQPMLNGVALAQNPAFVFEGPAIRQGFLGHIRELYPNAEEINRVWKARFRNMDELDLIWDPGRYDYKSRVGYQYDWQTYNQFLGTDFFRWMSGVASGAAPEVPKFVQVAEDVLAPNEAARGVDREALAGMTDYSGCAISDSPVGGAYALNYPNASFQYTLLRSFAPEKPVYNSGHALLPNEYPYGSKLYPYVYTAVWDGVMSGMNATALSTWTRAPEKEGMDGTLLDRPECLEAYATVNLDLNRLAEIVAAFQQAPADTAILWSMPSKIYEGGDPYLESVKRAYEGCSFCGRKVRFISEDQIRRTGLAGVNILVIPDAPALGSEILTHKSAPDADLTFQAINAYVEGGGVVIRPGNPLPFTARGTSRQDLLGPTPHTILVRGNDTPEGYLDAMDAAYSMGAVDSLPRAINEYGYPLEGVKTRYIEFAGHSYLYVLNLRKDAVRCTLDGPRKAGRDLLQGRWVTFPTQLQSLDPMLLQLEDVPAEKSMPVSELGKKVEEKKSVNPNTISRGAHRTKTK